MVREGEALAALHENIVVKVPMIRRHQGHQPLHRPRHPDQLHLDLQPRPSLGGCQSRRSYVSPFIGRLDDISSDGMDLIEDIRNIFDNYDFGTEILAASVRGPMHVIECAKLGADVMTGPLSAIEGLMKHPLTDIGLAKFLADHAKSNG